MRPHVQLLTLLLTLLAAPTFVLAAEPQMPPEQREFFEKQVRPVLATNCYSCHGPEKQKAGLRVDSRASLLAGGDSGPAVVPGKPDEGFLIAAINYGNDYQMPPKGKLKPNEIAALTKWVEQGAFWPTDDVPAASTVKKNEFNLKERAQHWSFQPIKVTPPPEVKDKSWPRSPVDQFILAKLEAKGLRPAPPADPRTLLRRVTFDLTGLPPTMEDIKWYLEFDDPTEEFSLVVDSLLLRQEYAERQARHWLDLVRYAETYGHEFDFAIPHAWKYRDYCIRAFDADVPYNDFVIEQIAGDLLPSPRYADGQDESLLGTGFWWFGEQTHSPVDVLQAEADRIDNQIDVFGKTFLGLTIACARCHDHKFDAISTADYYSLYGFLRSSRYAQSLCNFGAGAANARTLLRAHHFHLREALAENWSKLIGQMKPQAWEDAVRDLHLALPHWESSDRHTVFADFQGPGYGDWTATGEAFGEGPSRAGDTVLGNGDRAIEQVLTSGWAHSGYFSRRLQGTLQSPSFSIDQRYVHIRAAGRESRINFVVDGFRVIRSPIYGGLKHKLDTDEPKWLTFDVDMWRGHRAFIEFTDLTTSDPGDPIKADGYADDGWLAADCVVFSDESRPPSAAPSAATALTRDDALRAVEAWRVGKLSQEPDGDRLAAALNALMRRGVLGRDASDPAWSKIVQDLRAADGRLPKAEFALATIDGSEEPAHVFLRGNPKNLGPEAPRRFLEAFDGPEPMSLAKGSGRLELAKRVVAPTNPLTARVIVNRIWRQHFGEGLVPTPDDFGVMGTPPTHPELLDYLADEFMRDGWSIKRLHRRLLLTAAYQMSSQADPKAAAVDPTNSLLHHMPVRRLEAECIRDAMLSISGRLEWEPFGPSVPPHLTAFMDGRGRPRDSGPLDGDGRRSIYLGVRRNFLNPMFLAFDFPLPFSTMGRRTVSHVPSQALAMMNNPLVVQEAGRWAKRVLAEKELNTEARIERMYEMAFSRPPRDDELTAAKAFLSEQTSRYAANDDVQAWTDLAHTLFNVTEFVFVN